MAKSVATATRAKPAAAPVAAVVPLTQADDSEARVERFITMAAEGRDNKEIAKALDYTEGTVRVYRTRHRDRIRKATEEMLAGDIPTLLAGLKEMAQNKETPANVRLQAHRDLLDRAGMAAVTQINVARSYDESWQLLVDRCGGDEAKARMIVDTLRGTEG